MVKERAGRVREWWRGIPDVWKVGTVISAAMVFGMVAGRFADRLIAVPDLLAQTAAQLSDVAEIVDQHNAELERRGPIIDATYDLARANAQAIGEVTKQVRYLVCIEEATANPTEVRRCATTIFGPDGRRDGR